jgi:hypothetical protein
MPLLDRSRRSPKVSRRAVLAGSPAFPAPKPAETVEGDDKPKKRATRKRAAKKAEGSDE